MTSINGDNITVPGTATIATATVATASLAAVTVTKLILPLVSKGTNYPATLNDEVILVTATGVTITLPTAVGCAGKRFLVKLTAAGTATVATTAAQNIDGATPYTLSAQYKFVEVVSDGANWSITGSN